MKKLLTKVLFVFLGFFLIVGAVNGYDIYNEGGDKIGEVNENNGQLALSENYVGQVHDGDGNVIGEINEDGEFESIANASGNEDEDENETENEQENGDSDGGTSTIDGDSSLDEGDDLLGTLSSSINEDDDGYGNSMWQRGNYTHSGLTETLVLVGTNILRPIAIGIGILLAMIGAYQMLFADNDEGRQTGINYILWGVVGIIIMTVAPMFITTMVGDTGGLLDSQGDLTDPVNMIQGVYSEIAYPLLRMGMYIAIGVLFVVLLVHGIKFITSQSEEAHKHASTILTWNTIGILVIMGAERIVNFLYMTEDDIVDSNAADGIFGTETVQGEGLLNDMSSLEFVYNLINWGMGLISLVILVIIIYQAYLLLVKPDDEEMRSKLKNSIIYIFAGVVLLVGGYLLASFIATRLGVA